MKPPVTNMLHKLVRRFYIPNALRNRNTPIFNSQIDTNEHIKNSNISDTRKTDSTAPKTLLHGNKTPTTSVPIMKFDDLKAIYQKQSQNSIASCSFESFEEIPGIPVDLLNEMNKNGIFEPTPIQKSMLGHFFSSSQTDLLIKSQPGSGKSLGYILMLLSHFFSKSPSSTNMMNVQENKLNCKYLIIVPSELLAKQLSNWITILSRGGSKKQPKSTILCETFELGSPLCDFLIATPEVFRTKMAQGQVDLRGLEVVVLDEADALIKPLKRFASVKQKEMRAKHPVTSMLLLSEMFKSIAVNKLFSRPRMIVSSATLNKLTRDQLISSGLVKDSVFLEDKRPLVSRQENINVIESKVKHFHKLLKDPESPQELVQVLNSIVSNNSGKLGAIFLPASQSKLGLCELLKSSPEFSNVAIDLLCNYKPGDTKTVGAKGKHILIASDIDCRGIDIPELSFVIILDLPGSVDHYIHMAGRVGRTGQNFGNVYTILGTVEDFNRFTSLLQHIPLTSIPFLE